jgi:hypothetical protein
MPLALDNITTTAIKSNTKGQQDEPSVSHQIQARGDTDGASHA